MARERFSGQALSHELSCIQKRLDSVDLLTPDIVMNLLLSYRDVQVCIYYDFIEVSFPKKIFRKTNLIS